jgi:hypothetical protein
VSQTFETQIGGRTLTIETGKLARLAGGSVTVRYGDTMVLGTANRSEPRPGLDFFPLTVDFEERMYAAGKIPGGFIKREARPSENAILAARQIDRPIRPLFPEGYKDDIQLVVTVLSTDQENLPDIVGTIAASAALTISEIPFNGPIASVRVGRIDGEFVVNPTFSQLKDSELDLIVAGTRDAIMMVEAGANLLPEDVMAEAILFGHRALQPIVDLQEEIQKAVGKPKRIPYIEPSPNSVLDFASATDAKRELVVIDVETTGTDPKMADLVEVAAVKIKGTKVVDRWSTFVNPGRPIVGNQMHGITDKDVKGAPSPKEAADKLLDFVGDALVVGHNVGFDLGFVEEAKGDGFRFQPGSNRKPPPLAASMKPRSKPTLWPTTFASPTKASNWSAASCGLGAPLTSSSVMPCIWLPTIGRPGFTNVDQRSTTLVPLILTAATSTRSDIFGSVPVVSVSMTTSSRLASVASAKSRTELVGGSM